MSEEVQIDADGRLRCWKCGSINLSTGRSGAGMIGKAAIGAVLVGPVGLIGAAAARRKLRCAGCGSVNKPTDSPELWGPPSALVAQTHVSVAPAAQTLQDQPAQSDIARQAFLLNHTPGEVALADAEEELRRLKGEKPTSFKDARDIGRRVAEANKAVAAAKAMIKDEKKAEKKSGIATAPAATRASTSVPDAIEPVAPQGGVDPALTAEPVDVVVGSAPLVQPAPVAPEPQAPPVPPPPPTLPPAGWHADPHGTPGLLRYWDGTQWTEHTAPIPPPPGV